MKVMELQPHNVTNPDGTPGIINAMVEIEVADPVVIEEPEEEAVKGLTA